MKRHFAVGLVVASATMLLQCREDEVPTSPAVSTLPVNNITTTTATAGGIVTDDGGDRVFARGVVWSTSPGATADMGSKTTDGAGAGSFSTTMRGLSPGTVYYMRAYAENSIGIAYGTETSFITLTTTPALTTTLVSAVTSNSAASGGNVTSDGGTPITARGVCWSTTLNPTIGNPKTVDGTGLGYYASNVTGLIPGTKYYIRAYATNDRGTSYGNQLTFTTP